MSALARTALRLAAIAALNADQVIAQTCVGRVFDSRIETLSETEPVPVIIVLTEEMEGEAWSANNGGAPFDDHCNLVLEIGARATVVDPDEVAPYIGTPVTNAELEAMLDMIEHRAVDALTIGDTNEARLLRRAVSRRVTKQKSVRFADAETGIKFAERTLTLTVALKGEDQVDATVGLTGPFAALPDPLRSVCAAMQDGSSGQATCQLIAAAMPTLADPAFFTGVDETVAPQQQLDPNAAPLAPTVSGSHDTFGYKIDI